jgi:hypothetical protein
MSVGGTTDQKKKEDPTISVRIISNTSMLSMDL